jgi:hypothetical protein
METVRKMTNQAGRSRRDRFQCVKLIVRDLDVLSLGELVAAHETITFYDFVTDRTQIAISDA